MTAGDYYICIHKKQEYFKAMHYFAAAAAVSFSVHPICGMAP
jgi:hypothetical protein